MTGWRANDGFPWCTVFIVWLVLAIGLTIIFGGAAAREFFPDPDDQLRLQQVRDLMAGQGWFDLTQHRIAPPGGLAMHWSRLVDLPVLLFIAPLTPIVGARAAEVVALVGAPLLTLLALLTIVAQLMRRTLPHDRRTIIIACCFAALAPAVLVQIHPARIDHHGWQIVFASAALVALLDPRAGRSGAFAGLATALYLAISIEGAPFAAAAIGALGLLWLAGLESGTRLVRFVQSLAGCSLVANALLAPAARWTESQCDAVMFGHLAAMVVAALALTGAVPLSQHGNWSKRALVLLATGAVTATTLYLVAPACVGNPFGTMDPLVRRMWFGNVVEGMPLWRQAPLDGVTMIAFPLFGLVGTAWQLRGTTDAESRRRWLIVFLIAIATAITGMLVRRAAGTAHVAALPGVLVLLNALIDRAGTIRMVVARAAAWVLAVILLSPLGAVVVAAALLPDPGTKAAARQVDCALGRLNDIPSSVMMTWIDLGPELIGQTHHFAYVAGYHRLQRPLVDALRLFTGSSEDARAFMQARHLHYVLIAPDDGETAVYRAAAPGGFGALLADGRPPPWLRRVDIGCGRGRLLFQMVAR